MKIFEILTLAEPMINKILQAKVKPKDVQYLPMFSKYRKLSDEGHKTIYIEAVLCEEYNIGKTKFYEIIKSFSSVV